MHRDCGLSSLGGLLGTVIPGAILILLGAIYVAMGKPIQMPMHPGFFPNFADYHNMVLAAGIFLYYAGTELQAVHVKELTNPTRNYPLSVLIASVLVIALFGLGPLAVGMLGAIRPPTSHRRLHSPWRFDAPIRGDGPSDDPQRAPATRCVKMVPRSC